MRREEEGSRVSVGAVPSNDQGGGAGVDSGARIGLLERAAALRDEEHARAMGAKDAEMRAVLERREEAMRRAVEAEERLAVVVAAVQQQGARALVSASCRFRSTWLRNDAGRMRLLLDSVRRKRCWKPSGRTHLP